MPPAQRQAVARVRNPAPPSGERAIIPVSPAAQAREIPRSADVRWPRLASQIHKRDRPIRTAVEAAPAGSRTDRGPRVKRVGWRSGVSDLMRGRASKCHRNRNGSSRGNSISPEAFFIHIYLSEISAIGYLKIAESARPGPSLRPVASVPFRPTPPAIGCNLLFSVT